MLYILFSLKLNSGHSKIYKIGHFNLSTGQKSNFGHFWKPKLHQNCKIEFFELQIREHVEFSILINGLFRL